MHVLHLQLLLFLYGPLSLRNCCHKPLLVSELREQKCMMKYGPKSSAQQPHLTNAKCYYSCTTDGIDLVDDDHHLSRDKIIKYLEELFDTMYPDWKPVIETSVDTCLDKIKIWKSQKEVSVWSRLWTNNKDYNGVAETLTDCDPSGGVLFACIDSDLIHHCPTNQWDASPNCQNMIEHSLKKNRGETVAEQSSADSIGM